MRRWRLRAQGVDAVMVNSNPETVSTDFDCSTRLYFEPLDEEAVIAIIDEEQASGVVVQFGGQTAINLAEPLDRAGVTILGSSIASIDLAEDRRAFEASDALALHRATAGRRDDGPRRGARDRR